jgi:eukaryotic-like serine/threonine-protein kinase
VDGVLPRFRRERLLGVGGMGVVYSAHDHRLGCRVAVKIPRVGDGRHRWATRARILREAEALACVSHPHIVGLRDVAVEQDVACLVMDLVDGASLRGRVLPWPGAVAVAVQIGGALAALHAIDVVHRDVSPDNVLIDRRGRALLIDFGLARRSSRRACEPDDLLALQLSPSGCPAGTPAFMAPEQRRGGPPDPAADQYGLCATLFALLTGEAPRGAVDASTTIRGGPIPPSLVATLRRGLSEAPGERFPDMHALTCVFRDLGEETMP